jgi:hypothetical protein
VSTQPPSRSELPKPHADDAGYNNLDPTGSASFAKRAVLYRPGNTTMEPPVATASRVAVRILTRAGRGYSAEELMAMDFSGDYNDLTNKPSVLLRTDAEGSPSLGSMVISGALTPDATGDLPLVSIVNTFLFGGSADVRTYDTGPTYPRVTSTREFANFNIKYFANSGEYPASPSATWSSTSPGADQGDPALATGWFAGTGVGIPTTAAGDPATPADFIGQLCRVGDAAPFDWYLAETLATWRFLVGKKLPAWNEDQGVFQYLRISGTATNEIINIDTAP